MQQRPARPYRPAPSPGRLIVLAVVLVLGVTLAPSTADARSSSTPRVVADCVHARREPTSIVVACGDGATSAHHLHYAHVSPSRATGSGIMRLLVCTPSCSRGHNRHYPMHFVLHRVRGKGAKRVFTRLSVTYAEHHRPAGPRHVGYDLPCRPVGIYC